MDGNNGLAKHKQHMMKLSRKDLTLEQGQMYLQTRKELTQHLGTQAMKKKTKIQALNPLRTHPQMTVRQCRMMNHLQDSIQLKPLGGNTDITEEFTEERQVSMSEDSEDIFEDTCLRNTKDISEEITNFHSDLNLTRR